MPDLPVKIHFISEQQKCLLDVKWMARGVEVLQVILFITTI